MTKFYVEGNRGRGRGRPIRVSWLWLSDLKSARVYVKDAGDRVEVEN